MQSDRLFMGVDVAKASLSCALADGDRQQDFANEDSVIDRWLAQLPTGTCIAMEATGRHHLVLAQRAHAAGVPVFVLNALDVHFYAKSLGMRGKTDRLDAKVIARYLAEHHQELRPWHPDRPQHSQLQDLLRCRTGLATKRESLRQMMRHLVDLDSALDRFDHGFDELIGAIDARIDSLIAEDQRMAQGRADMQTVVGIGPVGSAMLTVLFSRVPFANADAAVAFTGLDPRPDDSGKRTGRRRITKRGNPLLRRQLYLAAFAASHSHAFGPYYRLLKARGLAPTEALVVLARKILRIAWAVWNSRKPFSPALIQSSMPCAQT